MGTLILDLKPQHSNPIQYNQLMKQMFPPRTIYNPFFYPDKYFEDEYITPTFEMHFIENSNERRAEVALLRIAYLIAYAKLGNGFFINGGLYKIREQILNPDKDILPKVFWLNMDFPKEYEGINIITLPKELRSFLIVFNLKTSSQTRQFAIVLPGPSNPGTKVYDFILDKLCSGDGTTFCKITIEKIPENDYIKKKNLAFGANFYWQEYTKDDYKPNY